MKTIEGLKRRIESTEELQSVVKTMKALAAVSIRQYEKAVASLADYNKTVEMGLTVVMRNRPQGTLRARTAPKDNLGAIVFGSDQGMCGPLNEQIVSYAMDSIGKLGDHETTTTILTVGERARSLLEARGQTVEDHVSVPGSIAGITPAVQFLVLKIEEWNENRGIEQITLFYSKQLSGASYRPHRVHLLPVDEEWLSRLKEQPWPSHVLPSFSMDWNSLFSALIHHYLFVSLFRAFAESLASENASRLSAMQGAERNIEDRLAELHQQFHQQRQASITSELLDIVTGFEALKEGR